MSSRAVIQVGSAFQAQIPDLLPKENRRLNEEKEKALLLWRPSQNMSDVELESYLLIAKVIHGYSEEQSLGLLYWMQYNYSRALQEMPNFAPLRRL